MIRTHFCRTLRLAVLGTLLVASPSRAAETAKQKEEIRKAISRGVEYLLKVHQPAPNYSGGSKQIGTACLAGMALLESGVDEKNPSLDNIIRYVRAGCLQQTGTYEVSLCLMFLDRLGHAEDEPFIQLLGARLLSGQGPTGGWSYRSGPPLSKIEETRLRGVFAPDPKRLPSKPREIEREAEPKAAKDLPALHPEVGKLITRPRDPMGGLETNPLAILNNGDNSNTQFAALALWVARKHGVPIDDAARRLQKRFRAMQLRDGGWAYVAQADLPFAVEINSTAPMTCAGLIGLAVPSGVQQTEFRSRALGDKLPPPKVPRNPLHDSESIQAGLRTLSAFVTGRRGAEPELRIADVMQIDPLDGGEMRANLYSLWSLQRVAVVYGLETIGGVDWYLWGADSLVRTQLADGSWKSSFVGSAADINVSFALLFLHRTNVARDLTTVLVGKVNDPGATPRAVEKTPAKKPLEVPNPDREYETQVVRLADEVLAAASKRRAELLEALREGKGSVYTDALARVAAKSTGEEKARVLDSLARRLTRMTAATLRTMLADLDPEVRLAAIRACGLKLDRQHIPDLIDLLADKEASIVREAHQSLKRLTGEDFGPRENATAVERNEAISAWRNWYKSQK